MKQEKCTAIVLAAGRGRRMNSSIQKQFLELQGKPVVYYSLDCFQNSPLIEKIVLVTGKDSLSYCKKEIVDRYHLSKVTEIVPGGKERYDSVYAGLLACENTDFVFIHDGARPFITEEILQRGFQGVKKTGACVVGMPSKDTVKIADHRNCIQETPDRSKIWTIQTPQIFSYTIIRSAYESIRKKDMSNITDDAMVAEQESDVQIQLTEGSYRNINITTPEDLLIAEAFLNETKF